MPEKIAKKLSDNVRLPEELLADLRKIAGEHQIRGLKPPKFGDLLLEAWRTARAIPHSDDAAITRNNYEPPVLESRGNLVPEVIELALQIKPENVPWIRKLLKVLESGRPDATNAVQSNLDVFAIYCDTGLPQDTDAAHTPQSSQKEHSARGRRPRKAG